MITLRVIYIDKNTLMRTNNINFPYRDVIYTYAPASTVISYDFIFS